MSGPSKQSARTATFHAFTFPPFPTVPEGVVITPFKDFRERGISIKAAPDGTEIDGLGIPTMAMALNGKGHDTDRCKTEAQPRLMSKLTAAPKVEKKANADGTSKPKEWWEEWEEADATRRVVGFNPNIARSDRFEAAIKDFNKNRRWPTALPTVRYQWDQFQVFIGNLSSSQVNNKSTKNDAEDEVDDDDDDDVSDSGDPMSHSPPPSQAEKPAVFDPTEEKEEKMISFLSDPQTSVKVYLSSYMRKHGYHFMDRNLFIHPKLVHFFLLHLLKNRVLTSTHEENDLKKALEVVEMALVELPLTSRIAKALPGELNAGLSEIFKVKKEREVWSPSAEETPNGAMNTEDAEKVFSELVEDGSLTVNPIAGSVPDQSFPDSNDSPAWGTGTNGSSGWVVEDVVESEVNGWGKSDDDNQTVSDDWNITNIPALTSLLTTLGPTTLPLTHQAGIIEWSVRRITKITAPSLPTKCKVSSGPSAEAVERDLAQRFHRVEMAPWLGWEDSSQEPGSGLPRINAASRGEVAVSENVIFEGDARAIIGVSPGTGFDPVKDSITFFVEHSMAELLKVGMGLGGTWVELVRVEKDKRASKDRYWYMADLMVTLTSFHTTA